MNRATLQNELLPFGEFFASLRRQGFSVGLDHYIRLQELLEKIGGRCAPHDLKSLLCPIFATNEKQQDQFYRVFDAHFSLFQPAKEAHSEKFVSNEYAIESSKTDQIVVRKWPYLLMTAFFASFVVVIAWMVTNPKTANEKGNPSGQQGPALQMQKSPEAAQTEVEADSLRAALERKEQSPHEEASSPSKPGQELSFYQRYGNTIFLTAILLPIALFLPYKWYRVKHCKLILQKQRGKKPPYSWPLKFESFLPKLYGSEQFSKAARLMRHRRIGEADHLDVEATVAATIKEVGYPSLRYKSDTKPPEYLVLIDRASFRDHQALLFDRLSAALEQEGLFVVRYFYDGDPRLCYCETGGQNVHLTDLQRRYAEHRLLIFGNGAKILNPITGRLEKWATAFLNWNDRALLTPKSPKQWGWQEITLASQFIVLPGTFEGLSALVDHFELIPTPDLSDWNQYDPEEFVPKLDKPDVVKALRSYLGEETFQWLCACAVYPELHWDLTLYMGSMPFMPENLVSEKNLLRLIRLPWFRHGTLPDELRKSLIRELKPKDEKAVRWAIVELLKNNPAPKATFAADNHQLKLLAVLLGEPFYRDRKYRHEVFQNLKRLRQDQIIQDYTLVRLSNLKSHSPLVIHLPHRLLKTLSQWGVPAFGWVHYVILEVTDTVSTAFHILASRLLILAAPIRKIVVSALNVFSPPHPQPLTAKSTKYISPSFEWLRSNLPGRGSDVLTLIIGSLLGLLVEILVNSGIEGVLITSLLTIYVTIILLAGYWQKRWMLYVGYLPVVAIILILIFTLIPPLLEWQEDFRHSFAKADERTINILISDFGSDPPNLGKEFTDLLYESLISKLKGRKPIQIDEIHYNLHVIVKRTNQVWTDEEMFRRGEHRGADLGVIGTYVRSFDQNTVTHYVKKLQCFVLDSSLAAVLEYRDPVDSLYDFSMSSKDHFIPVRMVANVSNPIQYISHLAENFQLLKIAYSEKDVEQRLKILIFVNNNFAKTADLLGSQAITAFHQGNSQFRNAKLSISAGKNPVEIYLDAAAHYRESIVAYQQNPSVTVIKYDPVKPYFNLVATYRQIYSLIEKDAWLDSAEVTYEQAAKNWPSQITTQEFENFLEERLEIDFVQERIKASDFGQRVKKYFKWNQALSNYITQSDKPHDQNQNELRALEQKRQTWEARRLYYEPSHQMIKLENE